MIKKLLWLLFTCLMILSLLLVSCEKEETEGSVTQEGSGQKITIDQEEEKSSVTEKEVLEETREIAEIKLTESDGTTVVVEKEKPEYGGIFTMCTSTEIGSFDPHVGLWPGQTFQMTTETCFCKDWTKGPSGTNEDSFRTMCLPATMDQFAPQLAESWDIPDDQTIIFNIRKGVYWNNVHPANGREYIADDLVFTIERNWFSDPPTFHALAFPFIKSVSALNKYTVEIKTESGFTGIIWEEVGTNSPYFAYDIIEYWGDQTDWRHAGSTGPYDLTDYVPGSCATLTRNENYWDYDPFFPENQLPYLDMVKIMIIPDTSTRLAAMRTGNLDHIGTSGSFVTWEGLVDLVETNPELNYAKGFGTKWGISCKVCDPELPFYDINVRKAMMLALDQGQIVEEYFGGYADMYFVPYAVVPEFSAIVRPWDEVPEDIKELYEYKPDKATQLLAEAGYPEGFKTSLICEQNQVDMYSIVVDYWSKVGIDLSLEILEHGAFTSVSAQRIYDELHPGASFECGDPRTGSCYKAASQFNKCCLNDPYFEEMYEKIQLAFLNDAERNRLVKEVGIRAQEMVYTIPLGAEYTYSLWWPWVKGYNGEFSTHYSITYYWPKYIWIDQTLKKSMGY
jgi:peptide/nickel transport system substrate-binding protein